MRAALRRIAILCLLLFCVAAVAQNNPVADPKAVVIAGKGPPLLRKDAKAPVLGKEPGSNRRPSLPLALPKNTFAGRGEDHRRPRGQE